jgi:hypothetical protein
MADRIFYLVISILALLFVIDVIQIIRETPKDKKMTHNRLEYLRDSLEMEYYKKQLESYPYDHSKIPTDDTIK